MSKRRTLPKSLRVQVLARDSYRCRMCGRSSDEVALEVDHVVPVASGGTDELSNLATLCRDCNVGKSSYSFSDYRDIALVPEGLESHFRFCHDPKPGDFERFHLYCYFQLGVAPGGQKDSFHHEWTIPGIEWDLSSDKNGLIARRRREEAVAFVQCIRTQLSANRQRLVLTEEGLCLE